MLRQTISASAEGKNAHHSYMLVIKQLHASHQKQSLFTSVRRRGSCCTVCCNIVMCVAVWCSVFVVCCIVTLSTSAAKFQQLQYVLIVNAVYCIVLQCVAECCSVTLSSVLNRLNASEKILLQCVLQCVAVWPCLPRRGGRVPVAVCALVCAAVCYSMLQCNCVCLGAAAKILLQCVAVCCSVLQCVTVCCSVTLSASAQRRSSCYSACCSVCCSVLQCVAVCCSVLQCFAVCCSVLQCVALCCTVLQCNLVSLGAAA